MMGEIIQLTAVCIFFKYASTLLNAWIYNTDCVNIVLKYFYLRKNTENKSYRRAS